MIYVYTILKNNIEISHSEISEGSVTVFFRRIKNKEVSKATCKLPSYDWTEVYGFTNDEINELEQILKGDEEAIFADASLTDLEYRIRSHTQFERLLDASTDFILESIDTLKFISSTNLYDYSMDDVENSIKKIYKSLKEMKVSFLIQNGGSVNLFDNYADKHITSGAHRIMCVETGKIYPTILEASKDTSVNAGNISGAIRGIYKSTKGLHWIPLDDAEDLVQRKELSKNKRKTSSRRIRCIETNIEYSSIKEAADITGIKYNSLKHHLRGLGESAGGLHWEYVEI